MKLKFNSDLKYQSRAIQSVVDVFKGQKSRTSNFTLITGSSLDNDQFQIGGVQNSTVIGNNLDKNVMIY